MRTEPGTPVCLRDVLHIPRLIQQQLEVLPESEVLSDPREFTYLNELLDQWSRLYATVYTEIARYPFWRYVTELVEDL